MLCSLQETFNLVKWSIVYLVTFYNAVEIINGHGLALKGGMIRLIINNMALALYLGLHNMPRSVMISQLSLPTTHFLRICKVAYLNSGLYSNTDICPTCLFSSIMSRMSCV